MTTIEPKPLKSKARPVVGQNRKGYAMKYLAVVSLSLLCGCATGPKMRTLNLGDDRAAVVRKLGRPDGNSKIDNVEKLSYSNRRMKSGLGPSDTADFFVVLKDGAVIVFGTGEIRKHVDYSTVVLPPVAMPQQRPMPPPPPLMPGYSR